MGDGICASGRGSLWPKATTMGLQAAQALPGPGRSGGQCLSKHTGYTGLGSSILTHKKSGIQAGSSQNKNKWLQINCEFFLKKLAIQKIISGDLLSLGPWELFQVTFLHIPL